jgi:phage head maturation protease
MSEQKYDLELRRKDKSTVEVATAGAHDLVIAGAHDLLATGAHDRTTVLLKNGKKLTIQVDEDGNLGLNFEE